jgi:hypothetical protein
VKGNSIEEDITLIEKSLCDKDTIIQYHYWVGTDFLNAVERIVADYKRVLKENEELKVVKSAIQTLQINSIEDEKYIVISKSSFLDGSYKHLLDDYIPIKKVKDKIEELKKNLHTVEHYETVGAIHVLQELLEKEK